MHAVGRFVYLAALALLAGGGALYTFVLTPAVFAAYPRDAAGAIVGTMMPHYFGVQLAAVVAAALALGALWRTFAAGRRRLCLGLLLAALAVQAFVQVRLYPRMLAAKEQVASFEAAPQSPERARFRALHGISMALNLLTIADGAVLLALVPFAGGAVPKKRTDSPNEE